MGISATRRARRLAWAAAVLIPVLAVILAATWLGKVSQAASSPVPAAVSDLENFQRGFTWVAQTIKPSVVFVEVEQKASSAKDSGGGTPDWRDLVPPDWPFPLPTPPRGQQPQPGPTVGQGSGVVVDSAGYIVTNEHVIDNAAKITVHLADGESYPATLVGSDPLTDLAVIKIGPKHKLVPAELGDADQLQVGSWAIAVGYPFGGGQFGGRFDQPLRYEPTITVGVISALNRQINSQQDGRPFRNLLQTDAPINPGNSGGPLVNIRAQVVGINQAIFTSGLGTGNIGVGFAVAINHQTREVIETLKGGKRMVRGRLGLLVAPLTETKQKVWGIDHGVYVERVEEGSPADKAGFKDEDIILSYEGKGISSQDEFVTAVQNTRPGTVVSVEVLREGKRVTLKPTVEQLSTAAAESRAVAEEPQKLGLTVEQVPPDVAQKAKIAGGVRVRAVDPVSDGARIGLRVGDIIIRINRQTVTDLASYRGLVNKLKPGDPLVLRVWRESDPRRGTGEFQTLELPAVSAD